MADTQGDKWGATGRGGASRTSPLTAQLQPAGDGDRGAGALPPPPARASHGQAQPGAPWPPLAHPSTCLLHPRPHRLYLAAGDRSRCGKREPGSHTALSSAKKSTGDPCLPSTGLHPFHSPCLGQGEGTVWGPPQCQERACEQGVQRGWRPPWGP